MKVIETTEKFSEDGGDSRIEVVVTSDSGRSMSVSFGEGEPEDMYLFRDLSDAYHISNLVQFAWECGKNGEDLVFEEKTVED